MKLLQVLSLGITLTLLVSGISFGGYALSKRISSILCYSCLGLEPKSEMDFTFNTVGGKNHPVFVTEKLKEKPVFVHYYLPDKECPGCKEMRPMIEDLEDEYGKDVAFIHINMKTASGEEKDSFELYDTEGFGGVPMFVIITLGDDNGIVKPYFATGYGKMGKDTSEEAKNALSDALYYKALPLHLQNKNKYN
ncbi:MAG: thioredoxin family protein [Candidatus Thermoplasmatota archaeon]|nr:thioredoxin family protein [Candidatus Thermoplasmatota archaeon]